MDNIKKIYETTKLEYEKLKSDYESLQKEIRLLELHNKEKRYNELINTYYKRIEDMGSKLVKMFNEKDIYETKINFEDEIKNKNNIFQIESLLDIQITLVDKYVDIDGIEDKVIVYKNSESLLNEECNIIKRLSDLYNNGVINVIEYNDYRETIIKEYNRMVNVSKELKSNKFIDDELYKCYNYTYQKKLK